MDQHLWLYGRLHYWSPTPMMTQMHRGLPWSLSHDSHMCWDQKWGYHSLQSILDYKELWLQRQGSILTSQKSQRQRSSLYWWSDPLLRSRMLVSARWPLMWTWRSCLSFCSRDRGLKSQKRILFQRQGVFATEKETLREMRSLMDLFVYKSSTKPSRRPKKSHERFANEQPAHLMLWHSS